MKVVLPTPLADYTRHRREVEADGATLAELLLDLDRRFPGIRFRVIDEQDAIRPHIKIFVNRMQASSLALPLGVSDEVRNGYRQMRVHFEIEGDASPEQLAAIVEQSRRRSAVYDVLANGTDVVVEVTTPCAG